MRGLLLAGLMLASAAAHAAETWILVDTAVQRLDVYRGTTVLQRFRNIALGSGGTATARRAGDSTTPLGEFRINRVNTGSRFHIFLGLDYPNLPSAERALAAGIIDHPTFAVFESAIRVSGRPPQDSPLGGNIGIHGIGQGDADIHRRFNWTRGCIALTNEEIEQLARLVGVGTRVFIR